jgi:hypothetical protein
MAIKQTRLAGIRDVYRILRGKPAGMRPLRDLNVGDRMHLHKVGSKNADRAPVTTIITPWVALKAGS